MTDVTVKKLTPDQIEQTHSLYLNIVAELYPSEDAQRIFGNQWGQDLLARECIDRQAALFTAAVPDHPLAGLLFGSKIEGGVGTVNWLGVDESCRGRFVGRGLLDTVEKFYAELGAHKTKMYCNTLAAQNFYISRGYQVEGFHPQHWWGMDCWSMGKLTTPGCGKEIE